MMKRRAMMAFGARTTTTFCNNQKGVNAFSDILLKTKWTTRRNCFVIVFLAMIVLPLVVVFTTNESHNIKNETAETTNNKDLTTNTSSNNWLGEMEEVVKDNDGFTINFHDIEFIKFVGQGGSKVAMMAYLNDGHSYDNIADNKRKLFAARILMSEDGFNKTKNEMKIMKILNRPPRFYPVIPEMKVVEPFPMKNPFRNVTYLEDKYDIPHEVSQWIAKTENISISVMEYLDFANEHKYPKTLLDYQFWLKGMLKGFEFAHQRNVIMRDVSTSNFFFDRKEMYVTLHDWGRATVYNKTNPPTVDCGCKKCVPPEYYNVTANGTTMMCDIKHANVHSYDIYNVGRVLNRLLYEQAKTEAKTNNSSSDEFIIVEEDTKEFSLLKDLYDQTQTVNPHERPTATQLLQHEFLMLKIDPKAKLPVGIQFKFATSTGSVNQ